MGSVDIIRLAKECPGTVIAVQASDLAEGARRLVDEVRADIERQEARKASSCLLTKEQVMQRLNVSAPTLWRWRKAGYLVPVEVGGQLRYKSQDIDKIVEGGKA